MQEIKMVDLQAQYKRLQPAIDKAMAEVIEQTAFINGSAVKTFQSNLEKYLKVKHVIPCANGTDALQVALMALGLKEGDEVITSTFTFIATVEVIALLKLKPVLVDVDLDTFMMIPEQVEAAITERTKAIIPVHLFGQGANMNRLMQIAQKYQLKVIEDTAQAIGSNYQYKNHTQKLGTIGDVGCTSFFPSKNLGCFGDGGACFTNDDELAAQMRMIVNHGSQKKYYHKVIGVNSRLDTLQAAILHEKLKELDDFNNRRRKAADFYDGAFKEHEAIQIPTRIQECVHTFHQYTLRVKNGQRDELQAYLKEKGIPSMVYYPVALHQQEAFEHFMNKTPNLPNAEQLCKEVLSLPMHTELTNEQLNYITDAILAFFE
ncbi:DegT/DnrJ/EryC1/StrS family aminotransferase [Carboxylicivirga litoralis]|uniref:DegT/DnrJ/EryC1/StrS family aminotransferase n=1 Tax=Carboxylicivirga litoralis TaxID=2816963 RepID=UPI0021CAE836|nr:DegT/DnrJ/EryC1/StrS family aminotransferase [Carboxylicivirga sp. A043]